MWDGCKIRFSDLLLVHQMVPTEAFENLDALEYDSDEEFFRARSECAYLSI